MDNDTGKLSQNSGIRMDLVKKYRKQIRERTYVVKSNEIASKMARELFATNPIFKGPQVRFKK